MVRVSVRGRSGVYWGPLRIENGLPKAKLSPFISNTLSTRPVNDHPSRYSPPLSATTA